MTEHALAAKRANNATIIRNRRISIYCFCVCRCLYTRTKIWTKLSKQRVRDVIKVERFFSLKGVCYRENSVLSCRRVSNENTVLCGPYSSDKVALSVVYGTGTMPSDNASKGGQGAGRFSKPSGKVFFPHKGGGSTVARLPALLHDSFNGHVKARLVVL